MLNRPIHIHTIDVYTHVYIYVYLFVYMVPFPKVSERQVCSLAAAFQEELEDAGSRVESQEFLKSLARLSETGHEHRMGALLEKHGLQAEMTTTWVDIGLASCHPVLRIQDFLRGLSKADKVKEVFLQGHSFADFEAFWKLYAKKDACHPVFTNHGHRLKYAVPLYLHADEGTGQKKKGLLVLQFQPILSKGSRRAADLNTGGSTYLTRALYSVLRVQLYSKKKQVLYKLLESWADDWHSAFFDGIEITVSKRVHRLYPIVLGLKGDWQGLIKIGRLTRHFLRDAPLNPHPVGVCHLCQAGRVGFPWHHNDVDAAWLADVDPEGDLPWLQPSPLLKIPHSSGPQFFLIDIFHTLHKGIYGDFAASALVPVATHWHAFIDVWGSRSVCVSKFLKHRPPCAHAGYDDGLGHGAAWELPDSLRLHF